PIDISPRIRRQVGQVADSGEVDAPAGERFVDRAAALEQERIAGEIFHAAAIQIIGGADRDLIDFAQYVQEHDGELVGAGEGGGVAGGDGVEPAAAARAAGDGAVLAAGAADLLADAVGAVVQFGRERTLAHARRVGLDDADDLVEVAG